MSGKATVRPRCFVLMPDVEPCTSRRAGGQADRVPSQVGAEEGTKAVPSSDSIPALPCPPLLMGNLSAVKASRFRVATWQDSDLAGVHSSFPCVVAWRPRRQPSSNFKAMPREN